MNIDEIRERFLKYFEKRGCAIHPSDSLVPSNDPSLLFTGSGMNQFKDMFLGRGKLPFKRAATSQKCLRTGDLDRVGKTSGHHTFFEMLGHFSFGDYFKQEAIPWTWEFYARELGIPTDRLYVSVYEDDAEAWDIWQKSVGLPANRIFKLGEADNFWPASAPSQGPNGPCGPCSEIFYDFGAQYGCGRPTCDITCSCNRYVEIGNIVFTQFDRRDGGVLAPLPQRNIDFGGGLERVGAVMQGVHSNFDTDIFKPIIAAEGAILQASYGPGTETSARLRRIADHVRALTFCLADGANPSNDGRGYVVRRILRTALRDGVKLGHDEPFLHRLVSVVIDVMKRPYPYLVERRPAIEKVVKAEEEGFLEALERGESKLRELTASKKTLSGEDAFLLYDSFGLPIEITEDICRDLGIKVDRARFDAILKDKAEAQRTSAEIMATKGAFVDIKAAKEPVTEFLGYRISVAKLGDPVEATVRRIVKLGPAAWTSYQESKKDHASVSKLLNASELVESAPAETLVAVLLDKTPFYGESGGQIGDAGRLEGEARVEVGDCKRPDEYFFHIGRVSKDTLKVGAKIRATLDAPRRFNIMRNHTGTHLLQAGLRAVLGNSVSQAGSVVEPDRLRFDFNHFQAMTREEVRKVEDWCNGIVMADLPVSKEEMSKEEAEKRGAIAFFGEKYGHRVRVVTIGDKKSIEFCGGTHLEHTATIGQIKITSESSIQRGVRRIEAVTGPKAIELARDKYDVVERIAEELGCPVPDVPKKLGQLVKTVQELKQEIAKLRRSAGEGDGLKAVLEKAKEIGGEKILAESFPAKSVDDLRALMDALIKKEKFAAAILAAGGEKPAFVIGVREDLVKAKGLKAGDLAKEVGKACGGGGGGRELQAQAGGSDPSKIPLGLETFEKLVRSKLA